MANDNIGYIKCPITNQLSVVRRDCRGKLYYYSQAGKITPNLPQGQEFMNEFSTLWPNPNQPPDGVILKTLVNGAPPSVIITKTGEKPAEIPLTEQGEPKQTEKPLTNEQEKAPKPKEKMSAFSYLFGDSDD
jgi:hypothetical protein